MATESRVLEAYLGVSHLSSEDAVFRLLVELGAQFVGADEGSLLVLDEAKQELVFAMTVGNSASEQNLLGQRVPLGKGITGLAAQTHEVQIGAPIFRDVDQPETPKSVLAAPMLIQDQLVGVITAVSFRPDKRFSSADATLYGRIATALAVLVDQRRKLSIVEALQSGGNIPEAATEAERLDRQIVAAVTQLVGARSDGKAQVAQLLSAIAALVEE
jgi:GAF domain-containing protein